jgi:sugar phosphate isomerase/epimerase
MNRREFLFQASAGVAASKFPTNPRDRIAVASWPFRKLLAPAKGTLALIDFPKMIVDRFGVHAIEPLDLHFPSTDRAYLDKLRTAIEKAGSRTVNIPVAGIGGSFYSTDAASRQKAIEISKRWLDAAVILASPSIRVHVASAKTPPDAAIASESLKPVVAYATEKNVVVHLENDDPKSEEAFFLIDVINRVDSPFLRALPDFCNSALLERADAYNYDAVAAMFQHAHGICHVKDSEQDGKRMFHIDLTRTFAIAKSAGYRGFYSMEYDAEGDPFAPTQNLIQATLSALF